MAQFLNNIFVYISLGERENFSIYSFSLKNYAKNYFRSLRDFSFKL
jgi:hypothetical protein